MTHQQPDPAIVVLEPATTGPDAPIPYEKTDRTPQALQHLEQLAMDMLGLEPGKLVSLLGAIEDKGSVALFGEVNKLVQDDFRMYRVVSYDSRIGKFTHASRFQRADAERLYDQRREELA